MEACLSSLICLFETRPLCGICCKQRFRAANPSALGRKKGSQFARKEGRTVGARIKIQEQAAGWIQKSAADIFDEKFPMHWCPFFAAGSAFDALETNAVRSHQIEFSAEIGQGNVGIDP